MVNIEITL